MRDLILKGIAHAMRSYNYLYEHERNHDWRSSNRLPMSSTVHVQPAGNQVVATVSVTSAGPLNT